MISSSTRVASVTPDIEEGCTQASQNRRRFRWVARLYVPILTIILVMGAGRWLSSGHLPGDVAPELAVLEPGTGPASLKADEVPLVQDVLNPARPVVPTSATSILRQFANGEDRRPSSGRSDLASMVTVVTGSESKAWYAPYRCEARLISGHGDARNVHVGSLLRGAESATGRCGRARHLAGILSQTWPSRRS